MNAELQFPVKGVNKNWPNCTQPPETSPDMNNVRPVGTAEKRFRGGQRPGLDRWASGIRIGTSGNPIVAMCSVDSQET